MIIWIEWNDWMILLLKWKLVWTSSLWTEVSYCYSVKKKKWMILRLLNHLLLKLRLWTKSLLLLVWRSIILLQLQYNYILLPNYYENTLQLFKSFVYLHSNSRCLKMKNIHFKHPYYFYTILQQHFFNSITPFFNIVVLWLLYQIFLNYLNTILQYKSSIVYKYNTTQHNLLKPHETTLPSQSSSGSTLVIGYSRSWCWWILVVIKSLYFHHASPKVLLWEIICDEIHSLVVRILLNKQPEPNP